MKATIGATAAGRVYVRTSDGIERTVVAIGLDGEPEIIDDALSDEEWVAFVNLLPALRAKLEEEKEKR